MAGSSTFRGSRSAVSNRKRSRQHWKEEPAFLDACAALSSSTFGARRLPELKNLVNAVYATQFSNDDGADPTLPFRSSGGQTSSRHLRRRVTSHQGRKRHRYPRGDCPSQRDEARGKDGAMVDDDYAKDGAMQHEQTKIPRKTLRKNKQLLSQSHFTWQNPRLAQREEPSRNATSEKKAQQQKVHWMATHLWYAKRFQMHPVFGWKVPMVHTNRGARAALRLSVEHQCWVMDSTWRHVPLRTIRASTLSQLLQSFARLCPACVDPQYKSVWIGRRMATTLVYSLDSFPGSAIGPVHWMVTCETQPKQWVLSMWTHPCIQEQVELEIDKLVDECDLVLGAAPMASAVLQLRGQKCTDAIQSVLSPTASNSNASQSNERNKAGRTWDWGHLPTDWSREGNEQSQDCVALVPDGAVFPASIVLANEGSSRNAASVSNATASSPSSPSSSSLSTTVASSATNCQRHIQGMVSDLQDWDPTDEKFMKDESIGALPGVSDHTNENNHHSVGMFNFWLVRRRPCDPSLSERNAAMCGWDIHCATSIASRLLVQFVVRPSPICIPLGVVEETHLQLECTPPIPVFPRDYVDTQAGRKYWNAAKEGSNDSFHVLRSLLEGGWGRLPNPDRSLRALQQVDWHSLTIASKDTRPIMDEKEVEDKAGQDEAPVPLAQPTVMVRGAFGEPFANLFRGCGSIAERQVPASRKQQRCRRRRSTSKFQQAMPISKAQADSVNSICQSMQSSLSLPAVLMSHICVIGKYTFQPGDALYPYRTSDNNTIDDDDDDTASLHNAPMGFATCGSFSPCRGLYHGLAVVSAARLLAFLSELVQAPPNHPLRRAVVVSTGSIQIVCTMGHHKNAAHVALSLLI